MMKHKHIIFGFVGASGSGKTTLMIELLNFFPHLEIIKSTSTRPRRDDTDDLFYKLVDLPYMESPEHQSNLVNHEVYAGNHYGYERDVLDRVLLTRCGMFAILEQAVPAIRAQGYELKLIKVIPDRDWALERTQERHAADANRTGADSLKFDLVIENSFRPGGLEQSVELAAGFIKKTIEDHTTKVD
jgi:guanylate kinase